MKGDANRGGALPRIPVDYRRALEAQERLVALRQAGEIPDTLWLLEHRPVITYGTAGGLDHLRASREAIGRSGYSLVATRRGGDVTCHEPGQLVGYPIVQLGPSGGERDLHLYLRRLEESLIRLLSGLGLRPRRVEGRTGVWLEASGERPLRKIAALGVRCARWVTSHGLALNAVNDLAGFRLIVPCGISDAPVTSLARELGADALPSWDVLCASLHRILEETLERPLRLLAGPEAVPVDEA
ncbi:MAG: lipoyl(octanoyl) transferase LipB [Planctomycetes bacterium]|nr:lipoyl(octanoyl) transferase LipB [Planctomycetota bacterium]